MTLKHTRPICKKMEVVGNIAITQNQNDLGELFINGSLGASLRGGGDSYGSDNHLHAK